jgi:hypothetical protein
VFSSHRGSASSFLSHPFLSFDPSFELFPFLRLDRVDRGVSRSQQSRKFVLFNSTPFQFYQTQPFQPSLFKHIFNMKTTQLMMLAVAALGFTSEVMAQKGGNKNTNNGGNNAANQGGNNANAGNANAGTAANATATATAAASSNAGGNAADLALNPDNVQTGSQQAGNLSVAGTAASDT